MDEITRNYAKENHHAVLFVLVVTAVIVLLVLFS